ncbi:MAG: site-specific integrase [Deltaproteobacteria bacterium]|nr:site-specific integrase [Deltaproteobacteria bacterium]
MATRIKTEYPGVVYLESTSKTGKTEKVFYIFYRKDGKQIEEKVGRSIRDHMTAAKANRIRTERIEGRQLSNNERREAEQAAKEAEEGRWTIAKLWNEYRTTRAIKGIKTDEGRFDKFLAPAFGDKEPHEIDQLSVVRLKSKMLKTKAPQTVKNTLELLRRIVNFGVNARLCAPLPFKIEFPKCNNIVTEDLTPDQLERLLSAIEEDLHPVAGPIMLCALFTGMRRGEMFRLKWSDLDFVRGFINICDPKGGVDQTIPMNQRARELFESMPRESEFVFPGRGGQQRVDIKKAVRTIKLAAGIPDEFRALHGLRHVYASMLASSGKVDMLTLQKLMTHKSPDVTMRYAHLRDEALRSAGQVVDDIFASVVQGQAVNGGGA